MKKTVKWLFLLTAFLIFSMTGCAKDADGNHSSEATTKAESSSEAESVGESTASRSDSESGSQPEADGKEEDMDIKIQIGSESYTATLANNSSADALKKMLEKGSVTVEMSDYENMEKVGSLGTTLPRNDEQITTAAGDLILYQGNALVIYYAPNSWNFTRLGKINNVSKEELKKALGSGDVTVKLSLVQE